MSEDQNELFDSSALVVLPPALPEPEAEMPLTAELFGSGGRVVLNVVAQRPLSDFDRRMLWEKAKDAWTKTLADASVRAYKAAWSLLRQDCGKDYWEIDQFDVSNWLNRMKQQGLSNGTISLRLAGISSFYQYVIEDFTHNMLIQSNGRHGRLTDYNPASGRKMRQPYKVNPYGRSYWLNAQQLRAVLQAIPQDNLQGLRDYALFLGYVHTGRRNQELRKLRWGDLEDKGEEGIWYRWSGKGKENVLQEMPRPVWEAILRYLKAAGRLESMQEGDYLFTALNENVKKMRRADGSRVVGEDWHIGCAPISGHSVNDLLKRYCRLAGIREIYAHVHTLRHSSATLRLKTGQTVDQVKKHLGHQNIATTQIYIEHAQVLDPDEGWAAVDALLGLSKGTVPTPKRPSPRPSPKGRGGTTHKRH